MMPAHRKVTLEQLKILVELLEEHPHLGLNRARAPSGLAETQYSWQNMAKNLNGVSDGVPKTGKQWRSYWSEFKYIIKKKARRSLNTMGGKLSLLTSLEKRALSIIARIEGLNDNVISELPTIEVETQDMLPSKVKAEFPERITIVQEAAEAPRQRANLSRSSPSTESENSRDSDSVIQSTTENSQRDQQVNLPRWLYELETRRVAAEERMAEALEKLAKNVDTRLVSLEQTLLKLCPNHKNS